MTGRKVKESRYRIKDNYARFYLKNIEPRTAAIKAGHFEFVSLEQLNGWDAILGRQFENLVLNHINDLFRISVLNVRLCCLRHHTCRTKLGTMKDARSTF